VNVALLNGVRAKIVWACEYFGKVRSDPILDQVEQGGIIWKSDSEIGEDGRGGFQL
jgi:hypothetical protein